MIRLDYTRTDYSTVQLVEWQSLEGINKIFSFLLHFI